jgi:hypothetical protein
MKLGQDWLAFQKTMHPQKKSRMPATSNHVVVAQIKDHAVKILSDLETLSMGEQTRMSELIPRVPGDKKVVSFETQSLSRAILKSLEHSDVYHQLESIRHSLPATHGEIPVFEPHFLIQALTTGFWSKVLPSQFGIYIRLEDSESPQSLLVLLKRGKVDQFDDPDLSSLSAERQETPIEVVKYLREKYGSPVQAIYLNRKDWIEWCETENPWKTITSALRAERITLVPFKMSVAALIGAKAYCHL